MSKYMNMKIILGLLLGLILVQLIGALIFFNLPSRSGPSIKPINQQNDISITGEGGGKISLSADHPNLKVGELVTVSVMIDTNDKAVDGVDVSLQYDPKMLEPVLVNKQAFVPGRLFPDVPFNAYDLKAGTASMSGISTMNKNFIGAGTMGVISFKAKAPGATNVQIVGQEGSTTDTNMVANGKEILSEIKNVELTIVR